MGTSRGSQESTRGEAAGGSLPFVLAAGAAVVAFVLTRAFLEWNEDNYA